MSAHFVALSDLHLGYDRSVLNDEAAMDRLAAAVADLCSGETDRLILNGDAFEACVPADAGKCDEMGLSPFMSKCSRDFFRVMLGRVKISSLIIVWGNHDYAMWKKVADSCHVDTFTNATKGDVVLQSGGQSLTGAESFLASVIGNSRWGFDRIRSAYPNYVLGRSWPYLVFHHGHFLDRLILGQEDDAKYAGLKILMGADRPQINVNDENTVKDLHSKTANFIGCMWSLNSKIRELEWDLIRRGTQPGNCCFYPELGKSKWVEKEKQGASLGDRAKWYSDILLSDSTTPAPLGQPFAPSYLFIGHDHGGGFDKLKGLDGRNWQLVNTGGWTMDDRRKEIHGHITVWNKSSDFPQSCCAAV